MVEVHWREQMLRLSAVLLGVTMLACLLFRTSTHWQMTCYYSNFEIQLTLLIEFHTLDIPSQDEANVSIPSRSIGK